jgi:hypothetical protein
LDDDNVAVHFVSSVGDDSFPLVIRVPWTQVSHYPTTILLWEDPLMVDVTSVEVKEDHSVEGLGTHPGADRKPNVCAMARDPVRYLDEWVVYPIIKPVAFHAL